MVQRSCETVSHHLVLGGRRSGKSQFAENLVHKSGLSPVYIATGQAFDDEMTNRIAVHKNRRGADWLTIEEPVNIVDCLIKADQPDRIILVDCLTLWLNNLLAKQKNIQVETESLLNCLVKLSTPVILVSNELGLGIIPDNALAREFGDLQGVLNQALATACDEVSFIVAGLPITLKKPS